MASTKKNPIIAYIEFIISLYNVDPGTSSFLTLMTNNPFINIGDKCDYLCPDCGGFSYIGPMLNDEPAGILGNIQKRIGESFPQECCENYDSNDIVNAIERSVLNNSNLYNSLVCCNSFNDCSSAFIDSIQKYLFSDPLSIIEIYDKGIHEYGTIDGDSSLCQINAVIETLDDAAKISFFDAFYSLEGFVAYCPPFENSVVYAGTSGGFRMWW